MGGGWRAGLLSLMGCVKASGQTIGYGIRGGVDDFLRVTPHGAPPSIALGLVECAKAVQFGISERAFRRTVFLACGGFVVIVARVLSLPAFELAQREVRVTPTILVGDVVAAVPDPILQGRDGDADHAGRVRRFWAVGRCCR